MALIKSSNIISVTGEGYFITKVVSRILLLHTVKVFKTTVIFLRQNAGKWC